MGADKLIDLINVISLGAGVQSSTMALMISRGELKYDVRAAIFADTQAEPKAVYDWLDWLEKQLTFPVIRVTKGNLWTENMRPRVSRKTGLTYYKHFVPTFLLDANGKKGMLPRKCTHDFKLIPIYQALRKIGDIKRGEKQLRMRSLIGISTDEALRCKPAKFSWVENVYPLIESGLSRKDCLSWMAKNGLPRPPKSACVFCPYHNNGLWADMKQNQPDEFARAVDFEKELNQVAALQGIKGREFLHSKRVPLSDVTFGAAVSEDADHFINECEGLCGI